MASFSETEEQIFQQTIEWLSSRLSSSPVYIMQIVNGFKIDPYSCSFDNKKDLCFYDLTIKAIKHEVYIKDKLIHLNHLEFDVLYYLAIHHGQVLSKEQIYEAVWKQDYENSSQSVINIIYQLRKKIEPDPISPMYIKTVIGVGYKFIRN